MSDKTKKLAELIRGRMGDELTFEIQPVDELEKTASGKTLIYNSQGLLYNFDIATGRSTVLNTDFANKNNNDHVLSFDGRQIAISHHAEETNGQPLIYTVPVTAVKQ